MTTATVYTTQAAAVELRRIVSKLEGYPKKGTIIGVDPGVAASWDWKSAIPLGWTAHYSRAITKDASNWAVVLSAQVITDSSDGTHRARCTAAELTVLDAAVAAAVTLDATWNSATSIPDRYLRPYAVHIWGQSNAANMNVNVSALVTALDPFGPAVTGASAVSGTPITDAIPPAGTYGDAQNYSATVATQLGTLDALPVSVPIHALCNQGESEAGAASSPGPAGTVDFTNWYPGGYAYAIANQRGLVTPPRPIIGWIFHLNPNQTIAHLTEVRSQQDTAGVSDSNTTIWNRDDQTPSTPPHFSNAQYQSQLQTFAALIVAATPN